MMTSSNGNIFRVTGPLWGESTGHRWIPLTKASDAARSGSFGIFFDLSLNKQLNNGETGDLRHHRANYDVTFMTFGHGWNKFVCIKAIGRNYMARTENSQCRLCRHCLHYGAINQEKGDMETLAFLWKLVISLESKAETSPEILF